MITIIIITFVIGYLLITLEHPLKVDKLIPALAMMAIMWATLAMGHLEVFEVDMVLKKLVPSHIEEMLLHHLGKTTEILFFLIGAMTIVEIISYFGGFQTIKKWITTKKKTTLLWIMCILGFILSAIIDNLTATIVLIVILRELIERREERIWFAAMIVIAANAGGAWSPIGDVTTTMLWIGGKVTTGKLILYLIIPSIVCMALPTWIASKMKAFKGYLNNSTVQDKLLSKHGQLMLFVGLGMIVFVPIFKTITHLPPWVGMMLSVAVVALVAEIVSNRSFDMSHVNNGDDQHHPIVHRALTKIELPSILFFLGILMAVAALESLGQLFYFAGWLNETVPNQDTVVMILGTGSAVIDNVPLVAASLGMFSEGTDNFLWHFIAYAAGTGGSMLIIGSAAGVVAMGMEKIEFFWYFKKFSWLALIGFVAGAIVFILMRNHIFLPLIN